MYKSILNKCFLFIMSCAIFIPIRDISAGLPPMAKNGAGVNLTPEQVDRMTKELENIDKFFNSLPPEEQVEFLKQVEEAQKMINNLSEEELSQLMKDMEQLMPEVFEGIPIDALTKPITQPENLTPNSVSAPIKQEKVVLTKEEEEALQCIESIIKLINECNVKINSAPEVGHNIQRWIRSSKINNWPKDKNWQYLALQIDTLIQKITLLKSQDPVSLHYRHLKGLVEDKSLLNVLQKLEKSLLATVPYIDVPTLGIEKMKKESKTFLQKALTALGEATIKDDLIKKIDALLIKFGGEADKIKASEKKDSLRAQQQMQAKPQQGRTVLAGKPTPENDNFAGGRDSDYPFYGSGNAFNNYERGSYEAPMASSATKSATISPTQKSDSASSSAQPKSSSRGGSSTSSGSTTDKGFDKSIDEIIDLTVEITDSISGNKHINELEQYLKSTEPIDSKTINNIDSLQTDIESLTKKVNSFNRKINDLGELRKKYKSKLNNAFNKYKGSITKTRVAITNSKSRIKTLSLEKQFAYFKENVTFSEEKEKPLQLRSSLTDLADSITRLENAIQK